MQKASEFVLAPLIPGIATTRLGMRYVSPASNHPHPTCIGLAGSHQIQNANLAVHLAQTFIAKQTGEASTSELTNTVSVALEETKWPGRCQTVPDPQTNKLTWYLDGAQTLESLDCCMQWHVDPTVGLSMLSARFAFAGINELDLSDYLTTEHRTSVCSSSTVPAGGRVLHS